MGVSGRFDRATTEGKRSGKAKNCTKGMVLRNFFRPFSAIFCLLLRSFKHAKFSKVNAAEKFGVDF